MSKSETYSLILEDWILSLRSKNRGKDSVQCNFEELFHSWKEAGAGFDDLYHTLLDKAIKAHYPESHLARKIYKTCKKTIPSFDKTEKEFIDSWLKGIDSVGRKAFLDIFKTPVLAKKPDVSYGNMTASEYKAQRRYADQFPVLDTSELEERWRQQQYNLDLEDMMKNVLGDRDETNSGTN